jgi:hypothetical protein
MWRLLQLAAFDNLAEVQRQFTLDIGGFLLAVEVLCFISCVWLGILNMVAGIICYTFGVNWAEVTGRFTLDIDGISGLSLAVEVLCFMSLCRHTVTIPSIPSVPTPYCSACWR